MTRLRRSAYACVLPEDTQAFDLRTIADPDARPHWRPVLTAVSAAAGRTCQLDREELGVFVGVDAHSWHDEDGLAESLGVSTAVLDKLVSKGLLISDADTPRAKRLRERDEGFARHGWDPAVAIAHIASRWEGEEGPPGVDYNEIGREELESRSRESFNAASREHGPPPAHFYRRTDAIATSGLPAPRRDHPLFEVLRQRETARDFDASTPVTLEQLSTILFHAFGCHGTLELSDDLVALKKTSPSGGSLHPTEVYPLIRHVDGQPSGLYHYDVADHALARLEALSPAAASALAIELTAGQDHFRDAHILFILTCRFSRHQWKYRQHAKALRAVHVDAAHLSQTVYLVATALGLGAFFTAAINEVDIDERLHLDGIAEGAIAVAGVGVPDRTQRRLAPDYTPFRPLLLRDR